MLGLGDQGKGFCEKGKGNNYINRRRAFLLVQRHNIEMLMLNSVFNFLSGSHQSYSHNECFLVIFVNRSFTSGGGLGPVRRLFCRGCTAVALKEQLQLHFKVVPFDHCLQNAGGLRFYHCWLDFES